MESLHKAGVQVLAPASGSRPNSPYEDVFQMQGAIERHRPEVIVVIGGGSSIDAAKAANVLATFTPGEHDPEPFFGMGLVAQAGNASSKHIVPMIAVQTAASSAAHLTKYSNVTHLATRQKKLIIDEAITPPRAVFDYAVTTSTPPDLTRDGANDGISHNLESYLGAKPDKLNLLEDIALTAIDLIVNNLPAAMDHPTDIEPRRMLGLGTDLGGYAIMVGGTNGAHLNSFSLVDLISHGRACAILNPYYVVFFSTHIEDKLRKIGHIYRDADFSKADFETLSGKPLGVAVAQAMQTLNRRIGFPTTLGEIDGFDSQRIAKILTAAKNPQLQSKLQQMPVPLTADTVDRYMGPVLEAARTGDFDRIVTL
jgi:alcohol dehydrogenase class IV